MQVKNLHSDDTYAVAKARQQHGHDSEEDVFQGDEQARRGVRMAWRAADQVWRLIWLRAFSVALMLFCALLLPRWLEVTLPVTSLVAVALGMAAFNAFSVAVLRLGLRRETAWLFIQLLADVLGWAVFVYYSGGATNPLISLLLPLTAIGAAVLPARLAWLLAACAVGCYATLWHVYTPVRVSDPELAAFWHLAGMWVAFTLSAVVMVAVVLRMTTALRARDRALAEALQKRTRDEALISLGSLAAGAAHSLGTPLGTMRLLVDDLRSRADLPADARDDVSLIGEQIDHCRATLGVMTARAGRQRSGGDQAVAAGEWVAQVVGGWQSQRPHAQVSLQYDAAAAVLPVSVDATLSQALETLLNNAADASQATVEVWVKRGRGHVWIEVADRGVGLSGNTLTELGRKPLDDQGEGLGIGLFLARSALDRAGGQLVFEARPGGGTLARMSLACDEGEESEHD